MRGFFVKLKVTGNLKTFIKTMVSLKFHDANYPEHMFATIRKHPKNELNQLIIEFEFNVDMTDDGYQVLSLNRETAIKFSKELRKQIALLD